MIVGLGGISQEKDMSYEEALQAAGAEVMEFEQFGSYQGDWWAKVRYKGELGWAQGSYGSCSGCDAFAAEFGLAEGDCVEHAYNHKDDCLECQEVKKKYAEKLADFGRGYLGGLLTQEKAEEEAARNLDWDSEAQAMLDWLRTHSWAANVLVQGRETRSGEASAGTAG